MLKSEIYHPFNIRDAINRLCLCNAKTETTNRYLLRCSLFFEQRAKLLESLHILENTLINHCDYDLVNMLLYGSSKCSFSTNIQTLSRTFEILEFRKRFN